ncbi:hypothetical protein Pr1d_34760 [Bythopirellula goksoeyrii]|uniref:Uncharacterized protein n=1 Tax=Bythopirellula goksoeyrii TaxID=1400387 RepID=A0A5B9QAW4_9BACT|nr:hypothetical protein Pr1d_34760 [Bythopirellula goksoeyrii]
MMSTRIAYDRMRLLLKRIVSAERHSGLTILKYRIKRISVTSAGRMTTKGVQENPERNERVICQVTPISKVEPARVCFDQALPCVVNWLSRSGFFSHKRRDSTPGGFLTNSRDAVER